MIYCISTVPGIILWDVIHHRGSVRYGPVAKFIWQGSCFTFFVSIKSFQKKSFKKNIFRIKLFFYKFLNKIILRRKISESIVWIPVLTFYFNKSHSIKVFLLNACGCPNTVNRSQVPRYIRPEMSRGYSGNCPHQIPLNLFTSFFKSEVKYSRTNFTGENFKMKITIFFTEPIWKWLKRKTKRR